MRSRLSRLMAGLLVSAAAASLAGPLGAEPPKGASQPTSTEIEVTEPRWMEPLPVPADAELEEQIQEVQEALGAIYQQMVRRRDALKKTTDAAIKAGLYDEFERLRKEREDLEKLLHDLVDEAKLSEQTAIDAALARARWFERQQEYQAQKEELIRDRQE